MLNTRRGVAAIALVGPRGVAGCSGTPPASVVTVGVIGPAYDERGCGVGRQPEGAGGRRGSNLAGRQGPRAVASPSGRS
jgi:hypothetical protein